MPLITSQHFSEVGCQLHYYKENIGDHTEMGFPTGKTDNSLAAQSYSSPHTNAVVPTVMHTGTPAYYMEVIVEASSA